MFLAIPLSVLLVLFSGLSIYLLVIALAYFMLPARLPERVGYPSRRFALVVPAHNEEAGIAATVRSLRGITYPEAMMEVIVVADNCGDATAEIARTAGARVLERVDIERKGKGFALSYAFGILLRESFDAFVVIDADSMVNPGFLTALDARLSAGASVVQAYYGIQNPDASYITYVFAVGNAIENRLFYEAKGKLGLPALLRGNGMCFSHDVLARLPWNAHSIVEDTEYSIHLLREGIDVSFAPEALVLARQPETLDQARDQRVRWTTGNMKLSRLFAPQLLLEGALKRNLFLIDAGLTLIVQSKPLMLLGSLVLFGIGLFSWRVGMGGVWPVWGGSLVAGQVLYLAAGVLMEGFRGNRLRHLLASPFMIAWFFVITLLGILGYKSDAWVRTRRT